jgi:hypothetical protein
LIRKTLIDNSEGVQVKTQKNPSLSLNRQLELPYYGARRTQKALESIRIKVGKRKLSGIYKFMGIRVLYPRKPIHIKGMYRDIRENGIKISMNVKGRSTDNIVIERFL